MIVVSDASPIIGLAAIEQLDLLRRLYERVIVPEAVRAEVLRAPHRPGAEALRTADWIEVKACPPSELLDRLREVVDEG